MRSFLLFIAISLIALVFRILFATSDLVATPFWHVLAGQSGLQKPMAIDGVTGAGNQLGDFQSGALAKEWRTFGFPVSHPIRPNSEVTISGWYPPGLPWVQKSLQQLLGESWGDSVLKAVFSIANALQPGLIYLAARGLGWTFLNSFWVGLLAASSPILIASFAGQTSFGLCSCVLFLSLYATICAINSQSTWKLLAAGILLGVAVLVAWESSLPAVLLLAFCVFTFRNFSEGWVPATLMVIGFVGVQIPWHWKLLRHNQDIPFGTVATYAAFYLGTGTENRPEHLTERILTLSDPDSISYLASEDTTELNRARWFSTRGLQKIMENPGKWLSFRCEATGDAFVGSPNFWQTSLPSIQEKPERETNSPSPPRFQNKLIPCWLFGLLAAALASMAFGPDFHPAKRIVIAGLVGFLASAFLFWDGWGFGFRILAEPFLILSCGFLFAPSDPKTPANPFSS